MKALKIILPIALVLIALLATYFLAPLNEWKERDSKEDDKTGYAKFCASYWKYKFVTPTIDGGMLPEITVTPK